MKLSPTAIILAIVAVIVVVLIVVSATRRGAVPTPTPTAPTLASPSANLVRVADQIATNSAKIISTALTEGGYVVIHESTPDGTPGAVVGYSNYLEAGSYSDLTIRLTKSVKLGAVLFAMLHSDDGDKTYGFPDEDLPLKDQAGKVILQKFTVK